MAEHRYIPEPGETIRLAKPSWGPAFFAAGAVGLVGGIYAAGFIFSPFVYSIVGLILVLFALRSIVRDSIRSYFRQPRHQELHAAALPVETITVPRRQRP
jgi:uncharacterized membrane protein